MADSKAQNLRILKIKTGVVKRLLKDKLSYEKEAKEQEQKIISYKQEGKDEYFMKQQVNSLKETQLMIPDVQRRLQAAYDDLKSVTSAEGNEDLAKAEEFKAALEALKEAGVCVKNSNKTDAPEESEVVPGEEGIAAI